MSHSPPIRSVDPATLPYVWRVKDLAVEQAAVPTGHPALDAQLPGGGWPIGNMIEILQERPSQHAWQLLLPALAQALSLHAGPVILVGAPYEPFVPGLRAQGVPHDRLVWIKSEREVSRLWATEQALRCAEVAAVLAWLPQARAEALRRLHMAAQQQGRLLFVFRTLHGGQGATPARLSLSAQGVDTLQVQILKRRGPPAQGALHLSAHPHRLASLLESRRGRSSYALAPESMAHSQATSSAFLPISNNPISKPLPERSHVLDRIAAVT